MAYKNEYSKHDTPAKVDEEFRNLEQFLRRLITLNASRAPHKGDKTLLWQHNNGGTMELYMKNPKDGTYDKV